MLFQNLKKINDLQYNLTPYLPFFYLNTFDGDEEEEEGRMAVVVTAMNIFYIFFSSCYSNISGMHSPKIRTGEVKLFDRVFKVSFVTSTIFWTYPIQKCSQFGKGTFL